MSTTFKGIGPGIMRQADPVDQLLGCSVLVVKTGTIVRASPVDRSPFLLHSQELLKSLI
jgi:hypothetical protein